MQLHQRMTSCVSAQNITGLCNLNCTTAYYSPPVAGFVCSDVSGANDVEGTRQCLLGKTGQNATCTITTPRIYPSGSSDSGTASARASKCGVVLLALVAVAYLA